MRCSNSCSERHPPCEQDKRGGEAGYESRLRKAEEQVSAVAAAAEARSQAKMLAEVERYKARRLSTTCPFINSTCTGDIPLHAAPSLSGFFIRYACLARCCLGYQISTT